MKMMLPQAHEAVKQFNDAAAPLKSLAQEFPSPGLASFTNLFLEAVAISIEAEIFARQADRCDALQIQPERAKFCQERFATLNNRAMQTLARSHEGINQFRQDLTGYLEKAGNQVGKFTGEKLEQFRTELFEVLVEAEFKKSDLKQIDREVRGLLELTRSRGLAGLPDYLEERTTRMEKMRQQPGRGAEENIAAWCVAAAIVILILLGLIFFIHCGIFGCSITTTNTYITAMIVVALVGVGCFFL